MYQKIANFYLRRAVLVADDRDYRDLAGQRALRDLRVQPLEHAVRDAGGVALAGSDSDSEGSGSSDDEGGGCDLNEAVVGTINRLRLAERDLDGVDGERRGGRHRWVSWRRRQPQQ